VSDAETFAPVFTVLQDPDPSRRWRLTGAPVAAPAAVPLNLTAIDGGADVREVFKVTVAACAGDGATRVSATVAVRPIRT